MLFIFDGTTRLGEVLAVVVRFVDDWSVKQRLVCLEFLQKSMNGEELARELLSTLSVMLDMESNKLLSFMRDRASVNTAAMGIVGVVYPTVLSIGCKFHALDSVGDKFNVPNLHHFLTLWRSLFAHSPRVKALWKGRTGRAMASYSTTRWWSRWEVMNQVLQQFGDIEPFLKDHDDVSPATCTKLMQILSNPQQVSFLKLELAAVIDIGSYFVKATYNLEGVGILAVTCYEEVLKIRAAIASRYYPNVQAVARALFPSNAAHQQVMVQYATTCVQPGIQYFEDRYGNDSTFPVNVFKATRLLNPSKVHELQPVADDIDMLSAIPFLLKKLISLRRNSLHILRYQLVLILQSMSWIGGEATVQNFHVGHQLHREYSLSSHPLQQQRECFQF